ncbi:MAG TPA: spore maturation protein [Candidatus Agathobaculum pullicola]|nr:spore maturation protein [Candidatus Agathobaculum pullicola]
MQTTLIPLLLAAIGLYALYKHVDVFPVFLRGAQKGLQTAVGILPTLVGMLTVVYMLRASGAIDLAAGWLAPLFGVFGIPKDCVALALLKPISGGGGLALGSELIGRYGPDSYIGRVTAVMLGASETSLYTISVYGGYLGLKQMRYAIPAALCADLAAFATSAALVRFYFPHV